MGGGSSKKKIDRFVKATQNPERLDKFSSRLGLSNKEIKCFFDAFDKIDKDKSGEISIDEFFKKFDLDWTLFGKNIFAAMDVSGDNRVEFVEFLVGLWNYCTLDKMTLLKFSFDMFDLDGSGSIDLEEFKSLISMIHGGKNVDSKALELIKVFDKDKSGNVTFTEFEKNAEKTPNLMFHAFSLQRQMRDRCMGQSYWNKATLRRKEKVPNGEDLINFYHSLYNDGANLNRKEKKDAAQGSRVAFIKFKGMTTKSRVALFESPANQSKRIGKLMPNDCVVVSEEMEVGEELWCKIDGDPSLNTPSGWVLSKFITLEKTE